MASEGAVVICTPMVKRRVREATVRRVGHSADEEGFWSGEEGERGASWGSWGRRVVCSVGVLVSVSSEGSMVVGLVMGMSDGQGSWK